MRHQFRLDLRARNAKRARREGFIGKLLLAASLITVCGAILFS